MKNKSFSYKKILAVLALLFGAAMLTIEYFPIEYSADPTLNSIVKMTLSRGCGAVMFTLLLAYMDCRVMNPLKRRFFKGLLVSLPAFAVAVNNFPILSTLCGDARLTGSPAEVALFALECLFVGIFEETAFRGVVFLTLLEKRRGDKRQIFKATAVSSAIFGGIHIFNIFAGGVGATLLQVGYSFLIGGMLAVVLLKTKNIWICAVIHAIYNFCGYLMPTLGEGNWWDIPTVVFTALLGTAVAAYTIVTLLKISPCELDDIYIKKGKQYVQNRC